MMMVLGQLPDGEESVLDVLTAVRRWRETVGSGRAVALLGTAPLPFEHARMNYAPGGRTWQFVQGLVADGIYPLVLCERMAGGYDGADPGIEIEQTDSVMIVRMSSEDFHAGDIIPNLIKAFDPGCLVGASARPSGRCVEVADGRPVWVDLFGDPMAEAQARAARCSEGDQLTAYRNLVATLVESGDVFSVVSGRQRDVAIGQLGVLGRLNRETAGRQMVHVLPCAAMGVATQAIAPDDRDPAWSIADDAFVILWSGGFNTWCDVETLVGGIENAMEKIEDLQLVVTGGAIAGHDELSWDRFRNLVEVSAFSDRIQLLGSLTTEELAWWVERADLGLVTEKVLYERELGSSGRMIAWLEAKLPFVATSQSELVQYCVDRGVAYAYHPGDPASLTSILLHVFEQRAALPEIGERARRLAREHFSIGKTTGPLRRWVSGAEKAPDLSRNESNPLSFWVMNRALKGALQEGEVLRQKNLHMEVELQQIGAQLHDIHRSTMWRTWAVLRKIKDLVTSPWSKAGTTTEP